jgi:hypothetical protein
VVDPDEFILNCYRLADRYHIDPEYLLDMPMSRVAMHVHYTVKLIDAQARARGGKTDGD